jgi:hypothetical protein
MSIDPTFRDQESMIVEDNRLQATKETRNHQPLRDQSRSPLDDRMPVNVPSSLLASQFRESDKSLADSSFVAVQQQEQHHQRNNPTPQERRSIVNAGHQQQQHSFLEESNNERGNRSREQIASQSHQQQHFPGSSALRSNVIGNRNESSNHPSNRFQYQRRQEDDDPDYDDDDNDNRVDVKNESTQTRVVPLHRTSFMVKRPGNLLLSLQYFLLQTSISVCLLRVSGKFIIRFMNTKSFISH